MTFHPLQGDLLAKNPEVTFFHVRHLCHLCHFRRLCWIAGTQQNRGEKVPDKSQDGNRASCP